jgi:hypothetical protein
MNPAPKMRRAKIITDFEASLPAIDIFDSLRPLRRA